jgi:HSP20 family molecular chaperone IbpA
MYTIKFSNLDDIYNSLSKFPAFDGLYSYTKTTFPETKKEDVKTSEDFTTVSLDLPGYKKENIKVEADRKTLKITAKGSRGDFKESYTLKDRADHTAITSKFEDGVLTITIPKKESEKPFNVKIE